MSSNRRAAALKAWVTRRSGGGTAIEHPGRSADQQRTLALRETGRAFERQFPGYSLSARLSKSGFGIEAVIGHKHGLDREKVSRFTVNAPEEVLNVARDRMDSYYRRKGWRR